MTGNIVTSTQRTSLEHSHKSACCWLQRLWRRFTTLMCCVSAPTPIGWQRGRVSASGDKAAGVAERVNNISANLEAITALTTSTTHTTRIDREYSYEEEERCFRRRRRQGVPPALRHRVSYGLSGPRLSLSWHILTLAQ